MARRLSVVSPAVAVVAVPEPPKNLGEAVTRSEREFLVALRQRVADEIDGNPPAHALGPLVRQLREFDREIRALDARAEQEAKNDAATVEDGDFDASAV